MLQTCKHQKCEKKKIFLEDFCWRHLDTSSKKDYGVKLLNYLKNERNATGQNFNEIEINGITYPEYINFSHCHFINAKIEECSFQRADFRNAKLTKATLKDCHLEFSDFRGTKTYLNNADLRESHLNEALLQNTICTGTDFRDTVFFNADMVGAMLKDTILYSARFNNTRIRKESFSNFENIRQSRIRIRDENYNIYNEEVASELEATLVYAALKNNFMTIGAFEDEIWAFRKEQKMERIRSRKFAFSGNRKFDKIAIERWAEEDKGIIFESKKLALVRWFWLVIAGTFNYGVSAIRVFAISISIIFVFAFLYVQFGFKYLTATNQFFCNDTNGVLLYDKIYNALYFSVVTFTTLGYGDAHPIGVSRVFAMLEALFGLILMALSVSILVRNIFRS